MLDDFLTTLNIDQLIYIHYSHSVYMHTFYFFSQNLQNAISMQNTLWNWKFSGFVFCYKDPI